MNDENKKKIQALIQTLELIEVHGKSNLDMMLGCILTLEDLAMGENE